MSSVVEVGGEVSLLISINAGPCLSEHMAQKDFNLEHTKPLFVKNNLLTIHNLYIIRSLNELLKIVKFHSPISLFTFF